MIWPILLTIGNTGQRTGVELLLAAAQLTVHRMAGLVICNRPMAGKETTWLAIQRTRFSKMNAADGCLPISAEYKSVPRWLIQVLQSGHVRPILV